MDLGLVAGVVLIGFVHGVLPDHGWPIAATYALNRDRRFLYGLIAALILGIGHLVSSVALVLAYFWFSAFAAFAEGPWLRYVAGTLLILLGIHEYRNGGHGHAHEHGRDGSHDHGDEHSHHEHDVHHHDEHGANTLVPTTLTTPTAANPTVLTPIQDCSRAFVTRYRPAATST